MNFNSVHKKEIDAQRTMNRYWIPDWIITHFLQMTQPHIGPLLFSNFVWLTMNMSNSVLNFSITFFSISCAIHRRRVQLRKSPKCAISRRVRNFHIKMIFVKTWTIHKRKASWTTMSEKYSRLLSLFHQAGWYNMFTWTWNAKKIVKCQIFPFSVWKISIIVWK